MDPVCDVCGGTECCECGAASVATVNGHGMCLEHAEVVMKRTLTPVRDLVARLDATRMDKGAS